MDLVFDVILRRHYCRRIRRSWPINGACRILRLPPQNDVKNDLRRSNRSA